MRIQSCVPKNLVVLMGWIAALIFVAPAAAVVHIRDVAWQRLEGTPYISGVSFRADLTEHDYVERVEFSIDILGIETGHPKIMTFLGSLPSNVALDVPAQFEVWFTLRCSNGGERIQGWNPSGKFTYTLRTGGQETRTLSDNRTLSYDIHGPFGLTLADENRVPGPNALPDNSQSCWGLGQSIGVYFDPQGTICQGTIHPGTPAQVYIIAKSGQDPSGISGAGFRFTGVPSSWQVFPTANPNLLAFGDPFGNGVMAGFPCPDPGVNVVLYTVLVLASQEVPDVRFTIEGAYMVRCDPPWYSVHAAQGGQCAVNSTGTRDCRGRIVSVVPRSWSAVKVLYRN